MTEAAVRGVIAPDVTSDMRAARSHLARRFLKNPLGMAALSVLMLIVLAAIFAAIFAASLRLHARTAGSGGHDETVRVCS